MESSVLLLVWLFLWSGASVAEQGAAPLLAGQDMHLRSPEMTIYTYSVSTVGSCYGIYRWCECQHRG